VSSHAPEYDDLQLEEREHAATLSWRGASLKHSSPQRPADEFCVATPAASFTPVRPCEECETGISEDHPDVEKFASIGDTTQQLEQRGASAAPLKTAAVKVAERSPANKAQKSLAIGDILEQMHNWKPLSVETDMGKAGALPEESNQESSPKVSDLAAEALADKSGLAKQCSKSLKVSGLQSRLASLDDAIARLRTLQ